MILTKGKQMLCLILSKPQKSELCIPGDLVSLVRIKQWAQVPCLVARGRVATSAPEAAHSQTREDDTRQEREKEGGGGSSQGWSMWELRRPHPFSS